MLQNPIQKFKSPRISMVIVVGSHCFFTFRLQIKTEEPHFCPPPLFSFKHPNPKHAPFPSCMLTCVANIPSLCPLNPSHTPTPHNTQHTTHKHKHKHNTTLGKSHTQFLRKENKTLFFMFKEHSVAKRPKGVWASV